MGGARQKNDSGLTLLADRSRIDKNSPRIEMLGAIDELNCWVGVIVSLCINDAMRTKLKIIQHDLLDLSAGIEAPGSTIRCRHPEAQRRNGLCRPPCEPTSGSPARAGTQGAPARSTTSA